MTYIVLRCAECGTMLLRHDVQPGSRIECRCGKCNTVNTLVVAGGREGRPQGYEKRAMIARSLT